MEWDGKRELQMSKAETRFGDRLNKDIKGPSEWKHPVTGATLLVYERTNQERDGVKSQLFAMNEEKTGSGSGLRFSDRIRCQNVFRRAQVPARLLEARRNQTTR